MNITSLDVRQKNLILDNAAGLACPITDSTCHFVVKARNTADLRLPHNAFYASLCDASKRKKTPNHK